MNTKLFILLSIVLFPLLLHVDSAAASEVCKSKERAIERQISFAKAKNNTNRVAGLERALESVRLYCTDGSVIGKAEMKVLEKKEDVAAREEDLAEARQKGDAKKIAKREKKLEEARLEADRAERELRELRAKK